MPDYIAELLKDILAIVSCFEMKVELLKDTFVWIERVASAESDPFVTQNGPSRFIRLRCMTDQTDRQTMNFLVAKTRHSIH